MSLCWGIAGLLFKSFKHIYFLELVERIELFEALSWRHSSTASASIPKRFFMNPLTWSLNNTLNKVLQHKSNMNKRRKKLFWHHKADKRCEKNLKIFQQTRFSISFKSKSKNNQNKFPAKVIFIMNSLQECEHRFETFL